MNLFKRTKWKPKQKLRKEDRSYLLTEYHVSKDGFYILLSLTISLAAIGVMSYVQFLTFERNWLEDIRELAIVGIIFSSLFCYYFRRKASRIAKVLEIEKRLKRYGIED